MPEDYSDWFTSTPSNTIESSENPSEYDSWFDGGAYGSQASEEEWEWKPIERMKASAEESIGTIFGAGAALMDTMGFEGARDWAANEAGEWFQSAAERDLVNTNFSEIDSPLDAGKYAVELITSFAPDIVMMFAGGAGVGTLASRAAGKKFGQATVENMLHKGFTKNLKNVTEEYGEDTAKDILYKEATRRTARDTGALIGVSGFEGTQGAGQAYMTDVDYRGTDEASGTAAIGTGVAQMSLSLLNPLNKLLAGKLPKGKTSVAEMTLGEAAEETGQEVIAMAHEAGINPDVTLGDLLGTKEGKLRLIESGVAGALLGGTYGYGLGKVTGALKTKEKPEPVDTEEVVTEEPEVLLEQSGIDTSEDSIDPTGVSARETFEAKRQGRTEAMFQRSAENIENLTAKVKEESSRDFLYDPELPEEQRQKLWKEDIDRRVQEILKDQKVSPNLETRADEGSFPRVAEPDARMKDTNARTILNTIWSEYTNDVPLDAAPEQVKKAKVKAVKSAIAKAGVSKEPTNLKERKDKRVAKAEAKKQIEEIQAKEPTLRDQIKEDAQVGGIDVSASKEVEADRASKLQAREFKGQEEILKTEAKDLKKGVDSREYKASKYKVDGKTLNTREKVLEDGTKLVVMKEGSQYVAYKQEEGKAPERLGKAKSVGAAQDIAEGIAVESKATKVKKEDKPLTEAQTSLVNSLDINKAQRAVMSKLPEELRNDPEAETAFYDGVMAAARSYKEGKGATFQTHVVNTARGKILDAAKGQKDLQLKDLDSKEGSEKESMESQLTKDDTVFATSQSLTEKPKAALTVEVSVGDKITELEKRGNNWYKKGDSKSLGSKKTEAIAKVKKKMTPEVKKISVEDYLKEQEAKRSSKISPSPNVIRRTRAEVDAKLDKEIERNLSKVKGRRAVLDKIDTADKALKYLEALEYTGLVKNLKDKKYLKDINNLMLSNFKDKLKNIKIKDRSEFQKDHPEKFKSIVEKGGAPPMYFYFKDVIYVNKAMLSGDKDPMTSAKVLSHEVVHALTIEELKSNKELRDSLDSLLETTRDTMLTAEEASLLKSKYNNNPHKFIANQAEAKKEFTRMPIENYYALLNREEFLSEVFTNKDLQDRLRNIPLDKPKGKLKTLWDLLVSLVAKAFRLNPSEYSVLSEAVTIGTSLMSQKRVINPSTESLAPALDAKVTKKTWDEKVDTILEGELRGKPIDQTKAWLSKAADGLKDIGKGVTERLRKINPALITPLRTMERKNAEKNAEYQRRVKPFYEKYQQLNERDRAGLDYSLMNPSKEYTKKRDEILKKNGMLKDYKAVEKVLEDIYKGYERVGMNEYKAKPEYFPRRVKDVTGLMQAMKGSEDYNVIEAELEDLGENATRADKEKAIQQMIHTGRFPSLALLKSTSSKKRKINIVSSEWLKFYENSADALINHIYESNEKIHARELFGDVKRLERVQRRDELYKELEEDNLTEKQRAKKVGEIQRLEEVLKDFDGEFTNGISALLEKMAPNLDAREADEVIRLIRGRLTQRGMHGAMASLRNISLMSVLSSPTSAITQIGDLAFSIYKYGPQDTIKALLGGARGDALIKPEDLDLVGSLKEFQTQGSAKWLDKTLRWSGLQWMDKVGKTTTMNAAINSAKKMSLEKFESTYGQVYGDMAKDIWRDLRDNKNTENTRQFAFNELSNFQPVSMSEMPLSYLTAGNYRIFYALKSYNIKAMNTIYRESVHNWRTAKDAKTKAKAARDVGRLVFLMVLAGATADELKDLLLGRDAGSFSDNLHENLLKIAFMSRYSLDQGFSKGIAETFVKDILIPPTGFIDDPIRDMMDMAKGDPDYRTLKNLPYGRLLYGGIFDIGGTSKEEEKDQSRVRTEILDNIKGGASISSQKKKVSEYNRWVREYNSNLKGRDRKDKKKNEINYGVLTRARKSFLRGES